MELLGVDSFDEKSWDGKLRIVIFDIPERKRNVRSALRRKLIEWGFKRWQDSVWVTKKDVLEGLNALISQLKIERWVAVLESDNFNLDHTFWSDRTR